MGISSRPVRTKYGDRCKFCGWFQWYCPDLTTGHAVAKPMAVLEFEDGSCAMADVGDFKFIDSLEVGRITDGRTEE